MYFTDRFKVCLWPCFSHYEVIMEEMYFRLVWSQLCFEHFKMISKKIYKIRKNVYDITYLFSKIRVGCRKFFCHTPQTLLKINIWLKLMKMHIGLTISHFLLSTVCRGQTTKQNMRKKDINNYVCRGITSEKFFYRVSKKRQKIIYMGAPAVTHQIF